MIQPEPTLSYEAASAMAAPLRRRMRVAAIGLVIAAVALLLEFPMAFGARRMLGENARLLLPTAYTILGLCFFAGSILVALFSSRRHVRMWAILRVALVLAGACYFAVFGLLQLERSFGFHSLSLGIVVSIGKVFAPIFIGLVAVAIAERLGFKVLFFLMLAALSSAVLVIKLRIAMDILRSVDRGMGPPIQILNIVLFAPIIFTILNGIVMLIIGVKGLLVPLRTQDVAGT